MQLFVTVVVLMKRTHGVVDTVKKAIRIWCRLCVVQSACDSPDHLLLLRCGCLSVSGQYILALRL